MEITDATRSLSALAQETRLSAYRLLVQAGPDGVPAGRIAEALDVPPATLSFHLSHLANAGLVGVRREGRSIIYNADYGAMSALMGFLTENCCAGELDCDLPACETDAGSAPPKKVASR